MAIDLDVIKAKEDKLIAKLDTIAELVVQLKVAIVAGGDPVKLQAIADELDAASAKADAITAP